MKRFGSLVAVVLVLVVSGFAWAQTEPSPNPCMLAAAHVAACADQFCAGYPDSDMCPLPALGEDSCPAESIPEAEATLALTCAQVTADWATDPPRNVCMVSAAHYAECANQFCAQHPESERCPLPALGEDSCPPETIPDAEATLAMTCEQITGDWPTEAPPSP